MDICFLEGSIEGDWSEFNFNKAFKAIDEAIGESPLEYVGDEFFEDDTYAYEILNTPDGEEILSELGYDEFSVEEVIEDEEMRERVWVYGIGKDDIIFLWEPTRSIRVKVRNPPKSLPEKIALIDEIIDAQHMHGHLFLWDKEGEHGDADIDLLRKRFDEMYWGARKQ